MSDAAHEVTVTILVSGCADNREAEDYVRAAVGSEPGLEVVFASGRNLLLRTNRQAS